MVWWELLRSPIPPPAALSPPRWWTRTASPSIRRKRTRPRQKVHNRICLTEVPSRCSWAGSPSTLAENTGSRTTCDLTGLSLRPLQWTSAMFTILISHRCTYPRRSPISIWIMPIHSVITISWRISLWKRATLLSRQKTAHC